MSPFTARRPDGRPAWEVIYDLVRTKQQGDTVSHQELLDILGTSDKHVVYQAVARANKRLWATDNRSLRTERGVGYRVLLPLEHEFQAEGYRKSGRKKLKNALSVMKATDISNMNQDQQNWVTKLVGGLTMMAQAVDAHASKLRRHDEILKSLTKRIDKIEEGKTKK